MLLLLACTEYNPAGLEKDPANPLDTSTPESLLIVEEPAEVCDGQDNNGNGLVDEGFGDLDADGLADCLDQSCQAVLRSAGGIEGERACPVPAVPPVDPWNIELAWGWALPQITECLLGAIADLNGDQLLDIICHDLHSPIYVVSGDGTGLLWAATDVTEGNAVTVGDINSDGRLEIFAVAHDGAILSYSSDGQLLWKSQPLFPDSIWLQDTGLSLVDPFGQRQFLLVTYTGWIDPLNGTIIKDLGMQTYFRPTQVFSVADLNLDSVQEFYHLKKYVDWDGSVVWDQADADDLLVYTSVIPVQADSDPEGELAVYDFPSLTVYDSDGGLLWEEIVENINERDPVPHSCAGDVDGDGEVEFIFPSSDAFQSYNVDGSLAWKHSPPSMATESGSCSVFDFDLDGAAEVIVDYQVALQIVDGKTGNILFENMEYIGSSDSIPIVIDMDGDGSVEIVRSIVRDFDINIPSIQVFRNKSRDWPPGQRIWAGQDWSGVERFADGTIPRHPQPVWQTTKMWRGSPSWSDEGTDLRVALDACEASCEGGEVRIGVQLQNLGPQDARAGTPVAVYRRNADGTRTLDRVLTTTDWLNTQEGTTSWELVFDRLDALWGVEVVAGDDGTGTFTVQDCDLSNNASVWETVCGE